MKEQKSDVAHNEEAILAFWKEHNIFKKTLAKEPTAGDFVFFEGPPTANAKPGIHHLIARVFKDAIPRYKTMRGFRVDRKAGWDTHGLPVELQVEKKLGLTSKKEIEAYGVEQFNQQCRENVWEQIDLWTKFTDRIGYWVDQEHPYITYEKTYMESVWNILKTVSEKKVDGKPLLYKDYKVLPWCPRCGTALSSHELAQGYEDVKDLSVYVKFKVKGQENTYLLAWTTTPWTLPGNVGLAVGDDVAYVKVNIAWVDSDGDKTEKIICSQKFYDLNGENFKKKDVKICHVSFEKISVDEIIGLEYEPLYPYLSQKFGDKDAEAFARAYKVYPADFVTTEDGTGIVHTAVMYGQDDFALGTEVGLPKFHLVKEDGHFIDDMDFLSGRFVKEKDEKGEDAVAIDIIKDLAGRGFLFKKEKYAHSYPHCWRCKTPLIYYARDSWYIRMSALRDELVGENEKVHWEPAHIKDGRMGEWLRDIKDWAISRERYWGTPLPFWTNSKGELKVIGSVAELKHYIPARNTFTLVRHGEAESNVNDTVSCDPQEKNPLTAVGREQAQKAGEVILSKHGRIDVIITSPFERTKETAQIIAQEIGFKGEIIEDERLGELRLGAWNGKTWTEYMNTFPSFAERFAHRSDAEAGVESWNDMRERVVACMYDINSKYEGKNIMIVGHGGPLNMIALSARGFSVQEIMKHYLDDPFLNAEARDIDWRDLPHNASYEIDIHRPFIDTVELRDEEGNALTRVREVLDVWFDSGAMPFAQVHYPFAQKDALHEDTLRADRRDVFRFPADYICEAVDQTRGWFYTLSAVGVLMGKGTAYKNVICLTHILDAQGKKMSKSLGNVIDPWLMMDKYGVDALRLWMYTVNQPGDAKLFDEKTVDEVVKKVFNLINNIVSFYDMYALDGGVTPMSDSPHVLDRWIVARLHQTIEMGTRALDTYDLFTAGRGIRDFVGDFSTWYIRRSRDRFKSDDVQDRERALGTTRFVLLQLSKYMAPFTPFFAEGLYQKMSVGMSDACESVHLEEWPEIGLRPLGDTVILDDMQEVRALVSAGLELRNKAGIKVRQPLTSLTVKSARLTGRDDLVALIADELNVKEVRFDSALTEPVALDTTVTPELRTEGQYRELLRIVQDLRKQASLTPTDTIRLLVHTDTSGREVIERFRDDIAKTARVAEIVFDASVSAEAMTIDGISFVLAVETLS